MNKKITAYEQELIKAVKKIKEYKTICEANIVSTLYKNPELYYTYNSLLLEHFHENMWRVYFQIGYDIVIKERKKLDDITISFYLEKHEKLKEKYDEYGGFDKISETSEYIDVKNIESYINDLNKWIAVLKLCKRKYPIQDRISDFVDMSAEEIYDEYEAQLNDIFINTEEEIKSYSLTYKIEELIESLDEGIAIGLPYHELEILNKETSGQLSGNVTLVGGISNTGKSTFVRSSVIPSCLKYNEKLIIMVNEESLKKWQREMLVWTANNIFKEDLDKYKVRNGKFNEDTKKLLYKCAKWIKEKDSNGFIRVIPFKKYKTSIACKVINKYASMGVKYFILDTFKADAGSTANNTWFIGQQAMVDINDIVKEENKNVHITITFQLEKGASKQRYYTQDNVGVFKNIIDPVSTCIMIRNVFEDEYDNGKNKLYVYKMGGSKGNTKIPVKLDENKKYQLLFVVKNREGEANRQQIVVEHDMSRNIIKEVGFCHVPVDF